VSLIKSNRTTDSVAAVASDTKDRVIDVAAQAIPAGKRAGTTAVQGVRQGAQVAKEWAAPRLEDAVQGAMEWATPKLEDAVQGAREWVAPKIEGAADAVDTSVAPAVSSALRSTAAQVKPGPQRTGVRRLLNWRWLLGIGAAVAAAGAAAGITMRRRYASATAEAEDATTAPESQPVAPSTDSASRAEVNGQVTTPQN
jgi:hypothetical protein